YVRVIVTGNSTNGWASISDMFALGMPNNTATTSGYDSAVLADTPVAYWTLAHASTGSEPDATGHGNVGTYKNGAPSAASMPDGDQAADFNGSNQYLSIPSNAAFSIPTTGKLTWEAWIRPDVLQFSISSGGYIDYMGKCQS